ncbi:MAG: hypothetical protein IJQ93_03615 [Bacteroidales bacterium]|nr:hypothetical protein [Bacteroidales bacterium]
MPRFYPSVLIADAYGSVGEVTFYHRNGKCYYRKRSHSRYPGTAAQTSALDVHRRALAAWREVPQETQEIWNRLAEDVEPHRPPFDLKAHITGQNLFVSAYHGFATLGNEHAPVPVPFENFPPFAVNLGDAVKMSGCLVIPARVELGHCQEVSRYRLLAKIQLTAPGRCRHLGLLRNFLAEGDCSAGVVSIVIPGYAERWGFELDKYQVYARFILLDTVTGYRSQYREYAAPLNAL